MNARKYRFAEGRLAPETRSIHWPRSAVVTQLIVDFYETNRGLIGGDLLDAGCGTAPLSPFYERLSASVTRLDWSHSPHDTILDVLADLSDGLPFAEASFDTVVLSDVLEHLREPGSALAETRRVLRPGGRLVANVPFAYPLHERPHDYFRFTRFGLEHLAQTAGFQRVKIVALGGIPDVAVDVLLKAVAGRRPFRAASRVAAHGWQRAPRSLRAAGKDRLPLAYGLVAWR